MPPETKAKLIHWTLQFIAALGVTLITSYYTYKAARFETEIGYSTVVKQIEEMKKAITDNESQINETRGENAILRQLLMDHLDKSAAFTQGAVSASPVPRPARAPKKFTPAPANLAEAINAAK